MSRKYFIILLIILFISGCRISQNTNPVTVDNDSSMVEAKAEIISDPDNYNAWVAICTYLTDHMRYAELLQLIDEYAPLSGTEDMFHTQLEMYLAVYQIQAYLFMGDLHTAKQLVEKIEKSITPDTPGRMLVTYHNVSAILAMKMDMDYSNAIFHFNSALRYTDTTDCRNYCALLNNIAVTYYYREDTTGLGYARDAYKYSIRYNEPVTAGSSAILIAKMYIMSEDIEKSVEYADKAEVLIDRNSNLNTALSIVRGDIASLRKEYRTAEEYYSSAMESAHLNDPVSIIEILFKQGRLMFSAGDYRKAITLFKEGLDLSYETENIEYRQKMLIGLSDCYDAIGDTNKALEYYKLYHSLSDSLSLIRKERDFHKLMLNYERMEHETIQHRNEMAIQRSTKYITIAIAVSLFIIAVAVFLWFLYRRKNRMYRQLAEQYERYRQRTRQLIPVTKQQKESDRQKDEILYQKIDNAIMQNKLWRDKDISVEKLSGIVGSNRSYVSRVFNNFSGMSFTSYINMKRIEEATDILFSDTENLPLKTIADIIGFNSLSQFSKVFQKETGCPPSKYKAYSTGKSVRS